MSEGTAIGVELARQLRERNAKLQEEIDALWKCVDMADVAVPASHDDYWTVRAELRALMNRKQKREKRI